MFYRASDPATSTADWFKLSVNAIPSSLVFTEKAVEDGDITEEYTFDEAPDFTIEPPEDDTESDCGVTVYCEPDEDDYDVSEPDSDDEPSDGDRAYAADLALWKAHTERATEERDERQQCGIEPMWSTVWCPDDAHPLLGTLLRESGCRTYDHAELGLVFGVEGAGYSFMGGHWIPLRARLVMSNEYLSAEDRAAIFAVLREEAKREGEPGLLESVIGEAAK